MRIFAFLPLVLADLHGKSYFEESLLCDNVPGGDIITEICYFLGEQPSLCHFQGSANQERDYRTEMTSFRNQFCKIERLTPRAGSALQVSQYLPSPNIQKYGCWCNFESGMKKGRGEPVNDLDRNCHDLHMSYKCINADSLAEDGEECQPGSSEYTLATVIDKNRIPMVCKYANIFKSQPTCAARLCEVEAHFLLWFMEQGVDLDYSFDPSLIHDTNGGDFNFNDQCKKAETSNTQTPTTAGATAAVSEELKCCGVYPKRFPYHPHLGKDCCNNQIVFDTYIRECCTGEPDFLTDKGTC